MAFQLVIKEKSIISNGKVLVIEDVSDWNSLTDPAPVNRSDFGMFMFPEYVKSDLSVLPLDHDNPIPEYVDEWNVNLIEDGRVKARAYTVNSMVSYDIDPPPPIDSVWYLFDRQGAFRWDEFDQWVEATDDEIKAASVYTSNTIDLSILINSRKFQTKLNLTYIVQVKKDVAHGARQDELYYKRLSLDYIDALIKGAEINFAMSLFTIYYDIVNNINRIMRTGKLD